MFRGARRPGLPILPVALPGQQHSQSCEQATVYAAGRVVRTFILSTMGENQWET